VAEAKATMRTAKMRAIFLIIGDVLKIDYKNQKLKL
jgi:hypothetical protein